MQEFQINDKAELEQRIIYLEDQVRNLTQTLNAYFIKGRLRTDRTAPVDSDDIQTPDKLYDRILLDDYEYTVINDAGALKWRRVTNSVF